MDEHDIVISFIHEKTKYLDVSLCSRQIIELSKHTHFQVELGVKRSTDGAWWVHSTNKLYYSLENDHVSFNDWIIFTQILRWYLNLGMNKYKS